MPYGLKFMLYLVVAGFVVVTLANLLTPLGAVFNALFALVAGYLGVIVGRRVLGRKNL
jgi:uncharacterized membrane protein